MKIKKYKNPESVGYLGWIETKVGLIGFIDLQGSVTFYRQNQDGSVI